MNILERFIAEHDVDPTVTMNGLQLAGVISDNCVLACDVADGDCRWAIEWLTGNDGLTRPQHEFRFGAFSRRKAASAL